MHLANASACDAASSGAVEPLVVALPPTAAVDAGVLAPATVAAVVLRELPPHPATRTPITSVETVTGHARRDRLRRCLSALLCIGCPPAVDVDRLYARDGFRSVSLPSPAAACAPRPDPGLVKPP
jgi:hypothetical protein